MQSNGNNGTQVLGMKLAMDVWSHRRGPKHTNRGEARRRGTRPGRAFMTGSIRRGNNTADPEILCNGSFGLLEDMLVLYASLVTAATRRG